MVDQQQARKFWASWVRREIGGNDMVQEAVVSAALNEILQGRDNQAAADAARRTAQSLGIGVPTMTTRPTGWGRRSSSSHSPGASGSGSTPPGTCSSSSSSAISARHRS